MQNKEKLQFAVCIDNKGYEASLEVGKIYRVIPDDEALSHGYIRIIDESGEDYGFTSNRFYSIQLPLVIQETLMSVYKANNLNC